MSGQDESEARDGVLQSGRQELPAKVVDGKENIQEEAEEGQSEIQEEDATTENFIAEDLRGQEVLNQRNSTQENQDPDISNDEVQNSALVHNQEAQDSEANNEEVQGSENSNEEVQDSEANNQEIQDSEAYNQEVQDSEKSNQEIQDSEASNQEVQDSEVGNQAVQDPEASNQEVQDSEGSFQEVQDWKASSPEVNDDKSANEVVSDENDVTEITEEEKPPEKYPDTIDLDESSDVNEKVESETCAEPEDTDTNKALSKTVDENSAEDIAPKEVDKTPDKPVVDACDKEMSMDTGNISNLPEEKISENTTNKDEGAQDKEDEAVYLETIDDNSTDKSQSKEDVLMDDPEDKSNSLPAEDKGESEGMDIGLQISAVTGGEDIIELDQKTEDSAQKTDDDTEKKNGGNKDAGDEVVAMETEDSDLPAMVISEPRTVSEDKMEASEDDASRKGEADKSEIMEVDEKGDNQNSDVVNGETKSSNMVENVISENDSIGFKIISVSEAKDADGEITIQDDQPSDNQSKSTEADKSKDGESDEANAAEDNSGPKIVETTSLSDTPQRVTRSQTGSIPVTPKAVPFTTTKTVSLGSKTVQRCLVCGKVGKCKYNIVRNGDVKHLCNDRCFKLFRSTPTKYLRGYKASSTVAPVAPVAQVAKYKTCCVCQLMNVNPTQPFLNWSSMDFCGEDCLKRYKKQMKSTCGLCSKVLPQAQWATFCLKVGSEVKQFCNSECYLTYKNKTKVCSYCKKDASNANGKFKDFCSNECMKAYEKEQDEDIEIIGVQPGSKEVACAVCKKVTKPKHELTFEGKLHKMCSDPCYSAFQYANKLTSNTCDNCGVYCYGEGSSPQFIQFEGHQRRFCSTKCVNTFRSANKKMVQCAWCGLRKTNLDMVERVDANNKYQLFCSLNCLSLYRVNLQATSNQAVTCDQCRKYVPAQYHLTMSDASVRNFCSYTCVMTFQGQFGAGKQPPPKKNVATPAGPAKQTTMETRSSPRANTAKAPATPKPSTPAISSVTTLAPNAVDNRNQPRSQTVNIKSPGQTPLVINAGSPQVKTTSTGTQQQIIIQPPPPKQVKNKSLLCKPYVQTKATSCRPSTQTKETSTDPDAGKPVFIPVPVPIYIPTPMAMYSCPTPMPIPIPVPIPVPCFIPTTKKSAASILKHIKEIQEKIPDDPFEAELLRMAEAVATAEKGCSDEDSDKSDEEMDVDDVVDGKDPAAAKLSAPEGEEDMLEMALRMATEMSEPQDLESVVDPVPLNSNSEATTVAPPLITEEDEELLLSPRERRARNRKTTNKRSSTSKGPRRSKRQRVDSESESVPEPQEETAPPPSKAAAPDANFLLKYMYGVNAWKHWVVQKNTQLEKVIKQGSGRVKLFKTELLQCSADELNYSLCLFVKEVRKPNGDEYAADSILYLCLGIQNYLFENSRIDNIFTDIYYEKFTECLNEVVQRFKPKLNPAGQLVCRIEEEHLWECKQLGAHSPYVLLNTLVYFNTKYFMLRTPEDHMRLSFSHIMKQWKKNPGAPSIPGSKSTAGRSVFLRYYPGQPPKAGDSKEKKKKDEQPSLEQAENLDNPLRCPVKLYEFYLSKCSYFSSPESLKSRNDVFYLVPERSCVPDSPVWYSTQPMTIEPMSKMLHRIHLVKEVQEVYANLS